jgi:hypothetical protein
VKSTIQPADEIEVIDPGPGTIYGRIRVRESVTERSASKASIFLLPDELERHALECLKLAATIRARKTPDALP